MLLLPLAAFSQQYARPSSTVTTATNVVEYPGGSGTAYHTRIDETSVDYTDYVSFSGGSGTRTIEVGLSSVTDPLVHTGHVLRYHYGRSASVSLDMTFSLYQGTTLIASTGSFVVTGDQLSGTLTLTEAEAATITNYADLRIRVVLERVTAPTAASTRWYWAELEVPTVVTTRRRVIVL